ncbi:MAG: SDR family oxidoreductase [Candidatus Saccharimonadales bacterium]
MDDSQILITGGSGQLGLALRSVYPKSKAVGVSELDITEKSSMEDYDWREIKAIINCAAFTNVDGAQTPDGKISAWRVNDEAVGYLADIAKAKNLLLVHISTAYVFDGAQKIYTEEDKPNPLGEYAKSKAAGDQRVVQAPKHYIVRTDSVIGDGKNFARTMLDLGKKGIAPTVVADQIIRPTFTNELAKAIKFLIDKPAEFGIYNLTNEGEPLSWAEFTRAIFKEAGFDLRVTDTTLAEYAAGKDGIAPRPLNSVLDLTKIESIGFKPRDWRGDLREYVKKELAR